MREEDKLHFSRKYLFADLNFDNKEKLIDAFRDRVCSFYIEPAKLLDKNGFGFGCGLLCAAIIDSLARVAYHDKSSGQRIQNWLKDNIQEFRNSDLAERFYVDFRCGIVHEGRIKNPGEFSYESENVVTVKDSIVRINPRILLHRIEHVLQEYLIRLERDPVEFGNFKQTLKKDFETEVVREQSYIARA